jgi:hypothetical protein
LQNAFQNSFQKYEATIPFAKENTWKKYVENNKNPWSISYRIAANKLKTGNIMSTLKKTNGSMTIGQETADEIIKNLFLEAIRRLPTAEENSIELDEVKRYINILKLKLRVGIKTEIYQQNNNNETNKLG